MPLLQPAIDHVVVNVLGALDEAESQYRRLGFHLTGRGHHTLGSSNHLAIFGADYLELLGYEKGRAADRPGVWQHPPGLSGLVFKPPEQDSFAAELRQSGVPTDEPQAFSRPVHLPGGVQDARFRVFNVLDAVADSRVFFCHHFTPELVWRPEWQAHPNGSTGVGAFVIAADAPERTAAAFGRMFGQAALAPVPGGMALSVANGAQVLFLAPDAVTARYGVAPPGMGGRPERMVGLTLRTKDLAATRAALAAGDVPVAAERDGLAAVAPEHACGLILAFHT